MGEVMRFRKYGSGLISVLAMAASLGMAHAKSDIIVAMQLEPPHLDPTSAAAGAIDSVLYSNVFEGLTRFGPDGSVNPGLAERLGDIRGRQDLHIQTAFWRQVSRWQ